jgi:uncharacterized protein (DUF58 family)
VKEAAPAAPSLEEPDAIERFSQRASGQLRATLPWVAHAWLDKLTPAGRALTFVLFGAGSVSAGFGTHYPLYYLAVFLFTTWALDGLAGYLLRPRVRLERDAPTRCAAGGEVRVRARLTNTGRRAARDVAVGERRFPARLNVRPSPYVDRLEPGATAEVVYTFTPWRRGAYDLRGPQLLACSPLGLHHGLRFQPAPHRVLVYPRFAPLGAVDLPVGARHQPGGLQLVSRVGESEEFIGNREYRAGDRLRDLDQKAWARSGGGQPVVREFQQEYLSRIALVCDTHVPRWRAANGGDDDLEAAISLGAAVADALSRLEYVIDLFAVGPDLYHLQAGRSLAYLDTILDILACIEACRQSPFGSLGPAVREQVGQIGSAVVLLLDWDDERAAFVRTLRGLGVAVKVVVVRKGKPTVDPTGVPTDAGEVKVLTPAQARAGGDRL